MSVHIFRKIHAPISHNMRGTKSCPQTVDRQTARRTVRQTDWLTPISLPPPQASFVHGLIIICKIRIFDRDDYTAADLTSHALQSRI